jgi:proteasome lid subunit RPN8/RPN11
LTALFLQPVLRDWIVAQAVRALPCECCGLLEGRTSDAHIIVVAAHATRNLSERPERFEIDPADQFRILRAARERGNVIVGCFHSHPDGEAEPSPADRACAGEEGFVWVIAGVRPGTTAILRAHLSTGGAFRSLEWQADVNV